MRRRIKLALALAALVVGLTTSFLAFRWIIPSPLAEAQRAFDRHDYSDSVRRVESWMAAGHASDPDAILQAARSYAHLERWEEAEGYFVQVPLRKQDDLRLRARGLETRNLFTEAAAVYEQLLHRWPLDGDSLQRLAAIRGHQDRTTEALILARKLTQVASHQVAGHVLTGMLEFRNNNPAAAVAAFEHAMRLSPELKGTPTERRKVLEWLAEALIELGKPKEAEPYAVEARQLSSAPEPCWLLGRARQMRGDDDGAQKFWQEAIARSPNFVPALQDLGQLCLRRRQPAQAMEWFSRAREIEPNNSAIQYALDSTLRHLKQNEPTKRATDVPTAKDTSRSSDE